VALSNNKKNSLWLASQYLVILVLSLVGLKLNLSTFGKDLFSIWLLIFSVWGIGSSVDFGFGISTVKYVAQFRTNENKLHSVISTAFFFFLFFGICLALVGCIVVELVYLPNTKLVPVDSIPDARKLCYLSAAVFYLQYITILFKSILEGHEDFVTTSKITIANSILVFTLICCAFVFHTTMTTLAMLYVAAAALQLAFYAIYYHRTYPTLRIKVRYASFKTFKEVAQFSMYLQGAFILGSLIDPLTKYILGNYLDRRAIPSYEIAKRFSLAVFGLFAFAFKNALPGISKLTTSAERFQFITKEGASIAKTGNAYAGLFFGTCSIIFLCTMKYFYKSSDSTVIFLLFALAESVNIVGYILYVYLLGVGKAGVLLFVQACNVVSVASLLIVGSIVFKNNLCFSGYYLSVILGNIVMLLYVKKHLSISIITYFKQCRMWKMLVFHVILIMNISCIMLQKEFWPFLQIAVSLICAILFFGEIKDVLNRLKALVMPQGRPS
jgi:O-antigen/teichoic acid export membrane protein